MSYVSDYYFVFMFYGNKLNIAISLSLVWTICSYSQNPVIPGIGDVVLPECDFIHERYSPSVMLGDTLIVSDFSELTRGLLNGKIIVLNKDIRIPQQITIKRDVVIIGNGHKIYESGIGLGNNMPYKTPVDGRECFINDNGKLFELSKTELYQGQWIVSAQDGISSKLRLPKELKKIEIKSSDDVYITYAMWFIRRTDKVKSAKNGILELDFTGGDSYLPNKTFRHYTPEPYFYLSNYSSKGICIKDGKISWPDDIGIINKCRLWHMFRIEKGVNVEFRDLEIVGGMVYTLDNYGFLKMDNCKVTNSVGGGVKSEGFLFADSCRFVKIKKNGIFIQNSGCAEISNCSFEDIGHYGSNNFAVVGQGKTYVGNCTFLDTNYGAINVGMVNADSEADLKDYLIEYNSIFYSSEWGKLRQRMGFWDSGAIYIATNTKKTIVRNNRIHGVGGCGMNNAIYGDDGAYNLEIYCNIISGTQNGFDIDCRYVSPRVTNRHIPFCDDETKVSSNNKVLYNLFDGKVRIEENKNPRTENANCSFEYNIIACGGKKDKDLQNNVCFINSPSTHMFIKDSNCYFDSDGKIHSKVDYLTTLLKTSKLKSSH